MFKTRLVEDKRDIMKRIITALGEVKDQENNVEKVGKGYRKWREDLYLRMTHYSTKKEEEAAKAEAEEAEAEENK